MGTSYALLNKTTKEKVFVDNQVWKLYELFSKAHSNFIVYLLLIEWKNDHVIFVDDNNSYDFGEEFNAAKDVSIKKMDEWGVFVEESSWYFKDEVEK